MGAQQVCCVCSDGTTSPDKVSISNPKPTTPPAMKSRRSSKAMKKEQSGEEDMTSAFSKREDGPKQMGRKSSNTSTSRTQTKEKPEEEGGKTKKVGARVSEKVKATATRQEPEKNLLVASLLADFQESLRSKFKTRKQAFDELGGSDDGLIDETEFSTFLKGYGYTNQNLNKQLFGQLDVNKDGTISRIEFKSLFNLENEELDEFKIALRECFKSRQEAFQRLGGGDDGKIDRDEFVQFVSKNLGIHDPGKLNRVFNAIDDNSNNTISHAEFKALFQPDGEVAKVLEFKEDLRAKFKNRNKAFDKLGGADDGRIDRQEFRKFLEMHMGYENAELNDQLFNIVDDDNNGFITKAEFEALFLTQTAKVVELRNALRSKLQEKFRSRREAFEWLGGRDDQRVDLKEFKACMKTEFGIENPKESEEVFQWMDNDMDGFVTMKEFKQFF